jgi:DNA-binding GntR family transcriptional regulator
MPTKNSARASGSTVEAIANQIRAGIRSGRYMAGQRLVEADVTADLDVSRGPVREAFRRLAAEGLLELQHHRGARVKQLTRAEVRSLYQIREVLEGLATRLAAARMKGTATADRLDATVKEMDTALKRGTLARYIELNQTFHELLVDNSGNKHLSFMVRQLQTHILRYQLRNMMDLERLKRGHIDHHKIRDAVVAGEARDAETAMRNHIRRSAKEADSMPDEFFARAG